MKQTQIIKIYCSDQRHAYEIQKLTHFFKLLFFSDI